MRLSDVGQKVAKHILTKIEARHLVLPTVVSLKILEEEVGCRVQSIGMAYESHIKPILVANNISSRKCGTPVELQLDYKKR